MMNNIVRRPSGAFSFSIVSLPPALPMILLRDNGDRRVTEDMKPARFTRKDAARAVRQLPGKSLDGLCLTAGARTEIECERAHATAP